jgi:ABC-type sugar transport system substrate-binding protein
MSYGAVSNPMHGRHIVLATGSALVIVALSLALLVGCKDSRSQVPTHTCLMAGLGEDDPLWPILKASARSYVGTSRSLQVQFVAPARSDPAAVADLVLQSLDRRISAICLQSNGDEATRRLTIDLTQRGRRVILIGQDMPDTGRFGHVGWDEYQAGKALAAALKAGLQDRTTFMVLHAESAGDPHASRLAGFGIGIQDYTFLKELNRYDCQADPAAALRILAEQGRRYPKLGGWACLGDWPARVRLADLRQGLPAETSLAVIGALPPVWPLLEQGTCRAAVGTDYGRWGYEAVSLSELAYHRAVKPGETRRTQPRIVLAEEIEQYKREWAAWGEGKISPRPPASQQAMFIPR